MRKSEPVKSGVHQSFETGTPKFAIIPPKRIKSKRRSLIVVEFSTVFESFVRMLLSNSNIINNSNMISLDSPVPPHLWSSAHDNGKP